VCELIESLLPDDVRPSCDSVVAHLFVSCLYGAIGKLASVFREWKMQREKLDFLVAVGEKLCNMESTPEMQKLEGLTDASSGAKTEKNHQWEDSPEEFVEAIAQMVRERGKWIKLGTNFHFLPSSSFSHRSLIIFRPDARQSSSLPALPRLDA